MKKILLILGLILCVSITYAQKHVMVLKTASGQEIAYAFEESPKLFYKDDIVLLKTSKVEVEYKVVEVSRVYVDEVVTNIEKVLSERGTCNFVDDGFILNGFEANEKVDIFSMSGSLVKSYRILPDGSLYVDYSSLPKGYCIIKVNHQTFKIRVK